MANGLIGYLFWYMLWHPKAGGWGTTSHEPIADTRLLAVYHKPVRLHLWFASLSVGFCIATIAGLGVIFMFMCFYGVGVGVGTILGASFVAPTGVARSIIACI